MKQKLSLLLAAVVIFSGLLFFNSCSKTESEKPDYVKINSDLIELLKQKVKNEPPNPVEILNLKGKGYYGDINGDKIIIKSNGSAITNGTSCPDPGSSEIEQELVSIEREYTCGVGYRFLVTYKIISEFYPVVGTSPNFSGGRVRLKNASNVTIHTTPLAKLILPITGTVVGVNAFGNDLNEFKLTYRTDIVSESIYNSATSIQPNLFAYTDCPNYPTIVLPYTSVQSTVGGQHTTQPCLRIDKAYFVNSSGVGASVAGFDATPGTCFPFGYVLPDKHEIQIYVNNQWQQINLWKYDASLPPPNKKFLTADGKITPWDIWYIDMNNYLGIPSTISNGTYQVRYRNKQISGNGSPCSSQQNETWIVESRYISI